MRRRCFLSIGILCVCMAFGLYSYFSLKVPPEIRDPEEGIKALCDTLIKSAEKRGFEGPLLELKTIEGSEPDEWLAGLKPQIMALLALRFNHQIVSSEAEKQKIRDIMKALKRKEIMYQNLDLDFGKAQAPEYLTECKWRWIKPQKDLQLTLRICERGYEPAFIEASQTLTHPKFIEMVSHHRKWLVHLNYVSVGVFGITLLYLGITITLILTRRRKLIQTLPEVLDELRSLGEGGHFTAAHKLVGKALLYLPEQPELIIFKERLDAITEEKPREAERAFVKTLMYRKRIEQGENLAGREIEELKRLPGPEASKLAKQYEDKEKERERAERFSRQVEYIEKLKEEGRLRTAEGEADRLSREYPEPVAFQLHEDIRRRIEEVNQELEEVQRAISNGEVETAQEKLKGVVKKHSELDEAQSILGALKESKRKEFLRLVPKKMGKEILLFKKDTIVFGRSNGGKKLDVGIKHPKVSGTHLQVSLLKGQVIAKDLESTNGTYVRGEKIALSEIEDGDIVNLAKVYPMTVHIPKGKRLLKATLPETQPAGAYRTLKEEGSPKAVIFEARDGFYVMLREGVGIDFTSIGIQFKEGTPYELLPKDGIFLFKGDEKHRILVLGESIEVRGIAYSVEGR